MMYFFWSSDIVAVAGLIVIIFAVDILLTLYVMYGRLVLDEKGITAGAPFYFFGRYRDLKWEQIESIEYKPLLGLKQIRLNPIKRNQWVQICRSIMLVTLIKDYKQLFKDIILNTYDVTKVDAESLELAGLNTNSLGHRRSTTLIKIEEQE